MNSLIVIKSYHIFAKSLDIPFVAAWLDPQADSYEYISFP